ncbi:glucose-6-phosphate isomerase [Actinomadura sp. HBU206391]|uniref:glucose-6-phosphate isomerase n=1 Tax=Actinomadura sp. HBU206391 TaxID=2731692 RepID=UPI00164FBC68|nr:glucose-6-phosphate isomerase [Actinomadura sp. HBU206391]MBC6462283.1 glucose-6-phosphate isomerase [Actinomadura sp. HBU206391]
MTSVVAAGGVSVTIRDVTDDAQTVLDRVVSDGVPGALAARSAQLWGPEAASDAARRLGWLDLPESSRSLLPRLADLDAAGLDRVVLAGMGGSSLAAEVITRTAGAELTVLDTTDPHQVAAAVRDRLERTLVVVSSKSGTTIETDSHRRIFEQAFRDAGITGAELSRRFVVVTDPGSPLEELGRRAGHQVVLADPDVGGRFSALSAFGLVPSALAGVDVAPLLDEAAALSPGLRQPYDNPGLALGAALGAATLSGMDRLVLADHGSGMAGFGDWAEQLIAESTGKDGKGLVPVVMEGVDAPGFEAADDALRFVLAGHPHAAGPAEDAGVSVCGPLGAQFLLWQYATAVACRVIGVNPFDQPNVQESKDNTAALLRGAGDGSAPMIVNAEPALVTGAVEIHAPPELLKGAKDLGSAFDALLAAVPNRGYLAVMAYLDRLGDAAAAELRPLLAARSAQTGGTTAPVTFGWGPRFLHSTGQYHKGGPQTGLFLQITGAVTEDVEVPGRPYTLKALQLAQAFGDLRALRSRDRPAVRVHLRDRAEGLDQMLRALKN